MMASPTGLDRTIALLTRTSNPSAIGALAVGLASEEPSVRRAAAIALAKRRGRESQHALLLAFPTLAPDVQRAITETNVVRRLRPAVAAAIKGEDLTLCKRACRYSSEARDFRALPAMVDRARQPGHPYAIGLATTALLLIKDLSEQIHSPSPAVGQKREDPAFFRRAAVNALVRAVDSYGDHKRVELVEAFLCLATPDDLILKRILEDATHPANAPLVEALSTSPSTGVMHVLAGALLLEHPPKKLLDTLSARRDRAFVEYLLDQQEERPPLRAMEQVQNLSGFAWAEEDAEDLLLEFGGEQQAVALKLAAATKINKRRLTDLVDKILSQGHPAGRIGACKVVGSVKSSVAADLLRRALADKHPGVVAAAASQLRARGIDGSTETLISLLDHPSRRVKQTAQTELDELTIHGYLELYDSLDDASRRSAGQLVGKADPAAGDFVREELQVASLKRRLRAVELAEHLGLAETLSDYLIDMLKDKDSAVRAAAAQALSGVGNDEAVAALTAILQDVNGTVRDVARASLAGRGPIDVAESLVDTLQQELES